jgi:hypothetical protein
MFFTQMSQDMSLTALLNKIENYPQQVEFTEVIKVVTEHYRYTPTTFSNGSLTNESGQNEGSCKIFSFAQLNNLDQQQTLACFGAYYRDDVLGHPSGDDHGNIRNFMRQGWSGIEFKGQALTAIS